VRRGGATPPLKPALEDALGKLDLNNTRGEAALSEGEEVEAEEEEPDDEEEVKGQEVKEEEEEEVDDGEGESVYDAAPHGHAAVMRALLATGADVNEVDADDGWTVLQALALQGQQASVRAMLVGPGGLCSPRHHPYFRPSFLDLNYGL
jgi:ankyrin repeat protein